MAETNHSHGAAITGPSPSDQKSALTIEPVKGITNQQPDHELQQTQQVTDQEQQQQEQQPLAPSQQQQLQQQESPLLEVGLTPGSLASQLCPLGPKDRCTPSQAQAMGQQVLALLAMYEKSKLPLPVELQNTFDVFHRCLAVAYSTFFLNLYTKANAPCLLCHGCQSLYPPGQYIHHMCPALPPNIVPCRSRMWRRCLVPLQSSNLDQDQQKQRWKYVLEKFSHSSTGVVRRNPLPPEAECQLLEIPECKRGRFLKPPTSKGSQLEDDSFDAIDNDLFATEPVPPTSLTTLVNSAPPPSLNGGAMLNIDSPETETPPIRNSTAMNHVATDKAVHTSSYHSSRALDLISELVQEVRRLERDLLVTQAKLQAAEEQLNKKESDGDLRAKLASAIMLHRALITERDQAVQQSTHYQQLATSLQQQLDKLHTLHCAMDAHFSQKLNKSSS